MKLCIYYITMYTQYVDKCVCVSHFQWVEVSKKNTRSVLHIIHSLSFTTFIVLMQVEMSLGSKGLKTQNKLKAWRNKNVFRCFIE